MTSGRNPADPPLAEPGKRASGADVGGMKSSADGGLADNAARSTEHRDAGASVAGSPVDGAPASGRGTTAAPGQAPRATRSPNDDDDGPWRHAPVAPRDEDPLKSLGRAVSETVTGPLADPPDKPKA